MKKIITILIFMFFLFIPVSAEELRSREYNLKIENSASVQKNTSEDEDMQAQNNQSDEPSVETENGVLTLSISKNMLELEETKDGFFQGLLDFRFSSKKGSSTNVLVHSKTSLSTPDGEVTNKHNLLFSLDAIHFDHSMSTDDSSKKHELILKATIPSSQFEKTFTTDVEIILVPDL